MKQLMAIALMLGLSFSSNATVISVTSPTVSGNVSSSVSEIGGIVIDMVGVNGNSVVSQLSADSLFRGRLPNNPGVIGTQSGFTSYLLSQLGGGLAEIGVRVTLFDGDTASGDFDFNNNFLLLNGFSIGNFSDVLVDNTNSDGSVSLGQAFGFGDADLSTGWFYSNNSTFLANLFSSLSSSEQIVVAIDDINGVGDNYLDFKQGIDTSLISIGLSPSLTAIQASAPSNLLIFIMGLMGIAVRRMWKIR
ncbi:hypothetical protein [Alteromonas macleodii]|uniref:hypothetical protein n=1 Tax=Alteromonas macleodii TaxID=28108 RepID=UPI001930C62A|nr:hypothetical protein [Alteromonas macleodii]